MEKWKIEVKRLDEIRLKLGLSYYQIEKSTGINRSKIGRFFNCDNEPGLGFYIEVKDFLESQVEVNKKEEVSEIRNVLKTARSTIRKIVPKVEFIDDIEQVKTPIPKYKEDYQFQNDCECKLDDKGLLRRGKIKCTKRKEEHKF